MANKRVCDEHGTTHTWERMAVEVPGLRELERDLTSAAERGHCANEVWYGYSNTVPMTGIKHRLERLVGWFSPYDAVRCNVAYDLATDHLYFDLLPACDARCCVAGGH